MADRPLRPATRRRLGGPLPHQLADRPRGHPGAADCFLDRPCGQPRTSGINPSFPGLFRSPGQVPQVLLTRSPLGDLLRLPGKGPSFDLHALGTPPTFVLSQDQTLQRKTRPEGRDLVLFEFVVRASGQTFRSLLASVVVTDAGTSPGAGALLEYGLPGATGRTHRSGRQNWLLAHCSVVKEPRRSAPSAGARARHRGAEPA